MPKGITRNMFKFVCVDCGAERRLRRHEMSRRSRPRCLECGSTFLEPKTQECWNRMTDGQDARTEQIARREALAGLSPKTNRARKVSRTRPPQGSR